MLNKIQYAKIQLADAKLYGEASADPLRGGEWRKLQHHLNEEDSRLLDNARLPQTTDQAICELAT